MTDRTGPLRIVAVGPAPAGPDSRGGMASVMTLMADHPDPAITIRVVPTFVDASASRRLFVGVRGMITSAALVLFGRTDVLHVHLAHGGSVVRKSIPLLAARLAGVPAVVHAHSYDFAGWVVGLHPITRAVVRRALRAQRWVVLGSSHVDQFADAMNLPTDLFTVLHNPVVLPSSAPTLSLTAGSPDDPVTVIALGRLGVRKGSYDVVAAVATLPGPVRERLRVVLAGDGENDEVSAAAVAAGVSDVIEIRGWLGPAERDDLMATAQAFVLPSYEEGLPMALLEAMASGLAPIVTPVGGIPNVVTHDREGLLVTPGDVDGIAAALAVLVEDGDRRQRLRTAALRRSRDFDVAQWYESLTDLWVSLAQRDPTPR